MEIRNEVGGSRRLVTYSLLQGVHSSIHTNRSHDSQFGASGTMDNASDHRSEDSKNMWFFSGKYKLKPQ